MNFFVRSSLLAWKLPEMRELKDEHFNGKEKAGCEEWPGHRGKEEGMHVGDSWWEEKQETCAP